MARDIQNYIEDITRWREDMKFIFKWQNNILRTSAASEWNIVYIDIDRINDIDIDIDKINDRNYVIDKLTCEIMENKPLGSRM